MTTKINLLILSILLPFSAMAQTKKSFTLDDLIPGGETYEQMQPKNMTTTWWGDTPVENSAEACYKINVKTGEKTVLFSAEQLNQWLGADKDAPLARSCKNISFPNEKPYALLSVNKDKEREIVLIDFEKGEQIRSLHVPSDASNLDYNKASGNLAYVLRHNLYVVTPDGNTLSVSTDGSNDITYGEEAYRFEFGISKGTFWSPDGSRLAFYRVDQSMVPDYPQVDITARTAETRPCKYPMAGEASHKATVGVFSPKEQTLVTLQTGDPTDMYYTNISWSPNGEKIYMIELPRTQDTARLVRYDAATGAREQTLYTETNPKYVEPMNGLSFLPWDNSQFIYQSRRDGFNHLYLFDLSAPSDGKEKPTSSGGSCTEQVKVSQLTSGNWEVDELLGFNTKDKSVIYRSNETHLLQSDIYKVKTTGGKRTLLSNEGGMHAGTLSADGTLLLDRFSSPSVPRRIDLLHTDNGKGITLLDAEDPWKDYNVPEISCGTIKAADDSTDLFYRMIKPADFEPAKKYPAVVYVYGGPHLHNVDASRNYMTRGWEIYMAQKGYLMFILDNRGADRRGMAFESVSFRHFGVEEMKDQMEGVRYLKSLPYVDTLRLGVHGWSYGGFMTINLMLTYPEVFKAGVAGGPVTDWKYYEVMYGERYMGRPQDNPEGYKNCSLLPKAGNLKGRLQIIIGYNDPICVPQHSLSFLRACIDAGTQPDFFLYPGSEHNMAGKERVHLHERITRYFDDFLK